MDIEGSIEATITSGCFRLSPMRTESLSIEFALSGPADIYFFFRLAEWFEPSTP
jgi:hypothetical protein